MVGNGMPAFDARLFRLFDYRLKVSENGILQDACEVAGRPRFIAFRADAFNAFKGVVGGRNWRLFAQGG